MEGYVDTVKIDELKYEMDHGNIEAQGKYGVALMTGYGIPLSVEGIITGYDIVLDAESKGCICIQEVLDQFRYEMSKYKVDDINIWALLSMGGKAEDNGNGKEALYYYQKAADMGSSQAFSFIGSIYYNGMTEIPTDFLKAFEYFKKSANLDNPIGTAMLGSCYENGNGVEQNIKTAEKCYLRSVELGDLNSYINLGGIYSKDESTYAEAEKCYRKALLIDDLDAELRVGAESGLGLILCEQKRYVEGIPLLKKAANLNVAPAQYGLGVCYYNGDGVELDHNKAKFWWEMAYQNGMPEAKEELNRFEANNSIKKKEGCYVATCVYGSYNCPQVWILRRFRDMFLKQYFWGRCFVKIYYYVSPSLVKLFGNNESFKILCKKELDFLLDELYHKGYSDAPYEDIK